MSASTAATLLDAETEGATVAAANAAFAAVTETARDEDGEDAPHSELTAAAAAAAAAGTCPAERHYQMMNQSLLSLVTLCRGLTDHQGNMLIDIDAEPWCHVRPARSIKPKVKDYINEIERRWKTSLRPPHSFKVGPRPAAWTHAQLVGWLDKHPIVDAVEVAYLTSKVQEVRAAVIESNQLRRGNTSSCANDAGEVLPVIEIDMDANDGRTSQAQAPLRSPARGINVGNGGGNGTVQTSQAATVANSTITRADTFASLSESIKWLGTSLLASTKLYITQKEKDREMTIAENEKDRKAQLEMAKLEAENRKNEIANEKAKERIDTLRLQIDSLRKEKRQLAMEALSDNSSKRSKTVQDFLTSEIEQMTKETQEKEKELDKLLHCE